MLFFDLVRSRRSVREYLSKPVSREYLDKCFEATRLAPSACNNQPWSFIVVDNIDVKNKLAKAAFSGIYSLSNFAKGAAVLVLVIREPVKALVGIAGLLRSIKYSLIDLGMACEHFALAACELGLGTCFIGWFDERKTKKILKIPRHKKIDLIISVGYPKDNTILDKHRKPLDQIRTFY